MTMPDTLSPVICTTICAALISLGVLAHVSTHLDAAAHHIAHQTAIAEAQFKCPAGVKQSHLTPDGKLTCVFDTERTYGRADRRQYAAAR